MTDPGEHTRIGDFVAVQMQDGKHHTIGERIEELVRMPRRGQRTGFRFPVADHSGHDQIGIVERRSIGMREGVTQFSAFMNRSGSLGSDVAGNAAGK
jgi:hypothetical protein